MDWLKANACETVAPKVMAYGLAPDSEHDAEEDPDQNKRLLWSPTEKSEDYDTEEYDPWEDCGSLDAHCLNESMTEVSLARIPSAREPFPELVGATLRRLINLHLREDDLEDVAERSFVLDVQGMFLLRDHRRLFDVLRSMCLGQRALCAKALLATEKGDGPAAVESLCRAVNVACAVRDSLPVVYPVMFYLDTMVEYIASAVEYLVNRVTLDEALSRQLMARLKRLDDPGFFEKAVLGGCALRLSLSYDREMWPGFWQLPNGLGIYGRFRFLLRGMGGLPRPWLMPLLRQTDALCKTARLGFPERYRACESSFPEGTFSLFQMKRWYFSIIDVWHSEELDLLHVSEADFRILARTRILLATLETELHRLKTGTLPDSIPNADAYLDPATGAALKLSPGDDMHEDAYSITTGSPYSEDPYPRSSSLAPPPGMPPFPPSGGIGIFVRLHTARGPWVRE
jgi:hypothetical protein